MKTCTVTILDVDQAAHTVEVTADSLYEAIARALFSLRSDLWVGQIGSGLTTASITVRNPEVKHQVKLSEFEGWLNSSAKSPAEMALKVRLRNLLAAKK